MAIDATRPLVNNVDVRQRIARMRQICNDLETALDETNEHRALIVQLKADADAVFEALTNEGLKPASRLNGAVEVGARVRLKSGGPVMTVEQINKRQCLCGFHDALGMGSASFRPTAVESLWFDQDKLEGVDGRAREQPVVR
jgi:uncharacterized protein YodC (DUF2158 family)